MTTMLTWQADGRPGLEGVRVHLGSAAGFRAHGRLVRPDPGGDFTASYSLGVRDDGTLGRVTVGASPSGPERHITVHRSPENFWLYDDGSGSQRADFDGAVDVDLQYSPLFNSLPIRRLGAHRQRVDEELSVVFLTLPQLTLSLVRQRYRTIRLAEGPDRPAVVEFSSGGFRAELEVDPDGFVLRYPGLAGLISADRTEPAVS